MKKYLLLSLIIILPAAINAADFSLLTNQYIAVEKKGEGELSFEYQANILPGFGHIFNDSCDIYLSVGITLGWKNEFTWVPELLRTEFTWLNNNMVLRFGRINYSDPLGLIASGLFDGLQFSHTSMAGTFSIGAWYTGFLYKKTSYIVMNDRDLTAFNIPFNHKKFMDTYFSSRRLLMSLDWRHPSIADLFQLNAVVTAQIDLPKTEPDAKTEKFHSQYYTLKAVVPIKSIDIELGGSLETSQNIKPDVNTENGIALAGIINIFYKLPVKFSSSISLTGRFATGEADNLSAFIPLSNKFYGNIFKIRMPGSSLISLGYTARFVPEFGMSFTVSHFLRHDLVSYTAYPLETESTKKRSLGTEFAAKFVWSPFSDLQFNLGGGVFLPVLGNAAPNAKPLWLCEFTLAFAIY
ncbi:MAG: hypothetical protein FWB95_01335 [Treponema sp.]|nr:hypothetical protein [Treponema sp.]